MATDTPHHHIDEREELLEESYDALADTDQPFASRVDDLFHIVSERLGTDYATLSRVDEAAGEYIFERVTCPDDVDIEPGHRAALSGLPNCAHVVEAEETLVLADVKTGPAVFSTGDWGISCYLGAPVVVDDEVYGTFCFYDTKPREESFSEWEVTFVELLAKWVSYELTRERYIDRIQALNELNGIVRSTVAAAIEQTSRSTMETVICQSLANADAYEFAWIGAVDRTSDSLTVRAESGVEGVLDDVSLSVSSLDGPPTAPAAAIRNGEPVLRQDARLDGSETWQAHAEAFDYHSSVSVPIDHAGAVYGVLTVHATRDRGFDDEEILALEHLGEMLGHAITAVERKRALTSDTMVELTFSIPDALDAWGVSESPDGAIHIQDLIAVDGDTYNVYGTVSESEYSGLEGMVDELPFGGSISKKGGRQDDVAFEVRDLVLPAVTEISSLGGSVYDLIIEGNHMRATVHVSPESDPRRIVDVLEERYRSVDLISKREISRKTDEAPFLVDGVDELTERQLQTLRTAYLAGYFDRPRQTSGEEVADRLGIANSTFSQHLRTAQEKLFSSLFEESEERPSTQ